MVTYGGNRPTVNDNEILTAEKFNDATRFWVTDELPDTGEDGDVVFVIGDSPVGDSGELPGLGGWAELEEVSGTFTKHTYGDWVAYEWTADGSVKTDGGIVEVLAVGAGSGGAPSDSFQRGGGGGGVVQSLTQTTAGVAEPVIVGQPTAGGKGEDSAFASVAAIGGGMTSVPGASTGNTANPAPHYRIAVPGQGHEGYVGGNGGGGGAGGPATVSAGGPGRFIDFTGEGDIEYGKGSDPVYRNGVNATGIGEGGYPSRGGYTNYGGPGRVYIRVPAANAQNVTENYYRWISYATVENGVVTKVTKTPDNKPYTASAQEVECDASVQEGYLYENGEFTAPETDYSDEIAALTARLEELRNG